MLEGSFKSLHFHKLAIFLLANYKCTYADFNLITTQVTITGTNTQPCVRFKAVADSLGLEGVENLTLTLTGPPNVQLISPTADICIQDSNGNKRKSKSNNYAYLMSQRKGGGGVVK